MAKHIGIVGSGFAGLHLALYLQQQAVDVTLYADRSADRIRHGAPAVLARWGHTLERERMLGVNFWDNADAEFSRIHFYVNDQPALHFSGELENPASFVDPRLYLSRLQQAYIERGGHLLLGSLNASDLPVLAEDHDLIVVATGRNALTELFPRLPAFSPFVGPARHLAVGYFEGFTTPDPNAVHLVLSPGQGEIIHGSILTASGPVPGIFFEGVPGGDFDRLSAARYIENPAAFHRAACDVLRVHAPHLYEGVDAARFRARAPKDLLQAALTPVVRKGYAAIGNGRYAIAVGDVHILNDPLVGQGANTASHSAWTLGQMIVERDRFDREFARDAETAIWDYAQHVVNWSNLMLQPPPAHVRHLMHAAARNPALASAFANTFHQPSRAAVLQSAEATEALIASYAVA